MIHCLQIAVTAAIIGYVYAAILIQPGEALHWLYSLFRKYLTKTTIVDTDVPEELRGIPGVVSHKEEVKEHWLLKPLGACEKCVSGQLAFWIFLLHQKIEYYYSGYDSIFTVINHIYTICLAILLTILIKKMFLRL